MLTLTIPSRELFDEEKEEFIYTRSFELVLEHSLVSLGKWESKWKKPFLTKENKTREETIDYIRHMTITQKVPDEVYNNLTKENIDAVLEYIDDSMTATTIKDTGGSSSRTVVTAELIYYWMIAYQIPFECQKWHLNRLLTLIRVCNVKNQPQKKRNKADILKQNRQLNEARRAKLNTKG